MDLTRDPALLAADTHAAVTRRMDTVVDMATQLSMVASGGHDGGELKSLKISW